MISQNGCNKSRLLVSGLTNAVLGKQKESIYLVCAFLSGGHVLIEDIPGVGKTTLATALARLSGLKCTRMQFTPDITPSDITGFNMFDKRTGEFVFMDGAVNTDIFLGDEINRATPKAQSALLEAMSEKAVSVDGVSRKLPHIFTVVATQNPLGFVGTYPLPEAQLDRFCMRFSMGYPDFESEVKIASGKTHDVTIPALAPVTTRDEIIEIRNEVQTVSADVEVCKYAVSLVTATRESAQLKSGASPRGSIMLISLAKAYAYIQGRDYVLPEDVRAIAIPVLNHRVVLSREAARQGLTTEDVLRQIIQDTPLPRHGAASL